MNLKVADSDVIVLERILTEDILRMRRFPILESKGDSPIKQGVLDEIKMLERLCDRLQRHHGGVGYSLLRSQSKPKTITPQKNAPSTRIQLEQQELIDEYGALCNPSIHGE